MTKFRGVTVGELVAILKNVDKDALVICQADAEGNGYSPLFQIGVGYKYRPGEGPCAYGDIVFDDKFKNVGHDCVIMIPS